MRGSHTKMTKFTHLLVEIHNTYGHRVKLVDSCTCHKLTPSQYSWLSIQSGLPIVFFQCDEKQSAHLLVINFAFEILGFEMFKNLAINSYADSQIISFDEV